MEFELMTVSGPVRPAGADLESTAASADGAGLRSRPLRPIGQPKTLATTGQGRRNGPCRTLLLLGLMSVSLHRRDLRPSLWAGISGGGRTGPVRRRGPVAGSL